MNSDRSKCIEWQHGRQSHGYGVYRPIPGGKPYLVHRLEWEKHHGPIPAGLHVLHRCDNPACYNIEHLFLGTPADNTRDMVAKGRSARGERHGSAKLTDDQIIRIRADKRTQTEIAAEYGIDQGLVSKIKRRHIWQHVG